MYKLGNREVIFSQTLVIPLNEKAVVPFQLFGDVNWEFTVEILKSDTNHAQGDITWASEQLKTKLTFYDWDNPFGVSISPFQFIETGGFRERVKYYILSTAQKMGNVAYQVELQVLKEKL
jgi:hypothetical protein